MLSPTARDYLEEEMNLIDNNLKRLLMQRRDILAYLTSDKGSPENDLSPLKIPFTDSSGTHEEQCGMRLGKKNAGGKVLTVIVNTHMNETAGLEAAKLLLDTYPQYAEALTGHQINILYGGQLEQSVKFFHDLIENKDGALSASDLESYRNTMLGANCNRILREKISPPDRTSGSEGWLQQKHLGFQKYYDESDVVLDLHTFSRPGPPSIMLYDKTKEEAIELSKLLARMGAEIVGTPKTDKLKTRFMCQSAHPTAKALTMMLECGQHLDPAAGEAAKAALAGLLLDQLQVNIRPEYQYPTSWVLHLNGDPLRLYTPGSKYAEMNPDGFLPEIRNAGRWDDYLHLITIEEKAPPHIRVLLKKDDYPVGSLNNGGELRKGQAIAYTYWYTQDGQKQTVILYAPSNGTTSMASQNTHIRQSDPTYFLAVTSGSQKITVDLPDH